MEKQSKIILANGSTVYFELANTPITNFCSSNNTVIVNNRTYQKPDIISITFGETYRVTSLLSGTFIYGFSELEYIDLAPFENVTVLSVSVFAECSKIRYIDFTPLANVMVIGSGFCYNCISLERVDLSPFGKLTTLGNNAFLMCDAIREIKLGNVNFTSVAMAGIPFESLQNIRNYTIFADTLELGEIFQQKVASTANWNIAVQQTPRRDWILKIFKSFNFRNNKIYDVQVEDPKLQGNPVNKRTMVRETTMDTWRAQRFPISFKLPWVKNVFGKRFKAVLDEILFPRIPYKYTNPKLDVIDFISNVNNNSYNIINDLGEVEGNGVKPKFQLFYDTNNFNFRLKFNIHNPDRPSAGQACLLFYDAPTGGNLTGMFSANNDNDSGIITVENQIFKEGGRIVFEKQYTAARVNNDTHGEPTLESGFTDLGYLYQEDLTAKFMDRFYMMHSPIIRLKTGADERATDVVNGNTPPAGFTYNYEYTVSAGAECLFDILIPKLSLTPRKQPIEYVMEINIRETTTIDNPHQQVIQSIHIGDIRNELHISDSTFEINGIMYYLGFINLGVFENHPVKIDFILKPY